MKFLFIFAFFLTLSEVLSLPSIPAEVLLELEMMTGDKISIEDLFSNDAPKYDAYRDVEFELYTQKNPVIHQRVLIDDPQSLSASNFNPSHPTRFVIHGANTNGSSESIQYPRAGYMKRGEFNVFGVNWSKGASRGNFLTYGKRLKDTGKVIAMFMDFLIRDGGASMDDMGAIGHSAGATLVSHVGVATNGTLPIQISLDPPISLPNYLYKKTLPQKSDAKYVEVIHTAADKGLIFAREALGHADYYPNGGATQPGCEKIEDYRDKIHCNHMIAIDYFAEAIQSEKGFWSKKCKTWEGIDEGKCEPDGAVKKMGGEPIDTTEGVFYLETAENFPYALGL